MNTTALRIAKNTSVLLISQVITWGMAILLAVFMPRYLGAEAIGKYNLASSLWAIIAIVIAWGMDTLLAKEIARAPENLDALFTSSILIRTVMFIFGLSVVFIYTRLVGYPQDTEYLIFVTALSILFLAYAGACTAALQGLERMEFVSLSEIIFKGFITFVAIALLLMGYGVLTVTWVVVCGSVISLIIQFTALYRLHPIKLAWPVTGVKWMLTTGVPYLINNWVRTVYHQVDVIIMSLIATETVIGWYGSAMRLYATLLFIPNASVMAVLPVMARMHTLSPEELPKLLRKNFDIMLLFGVPIGLGTCIVANPLVVLLFGREFAPSGPVLAIMGVVMIFTYQNMLVGQYLISSDRQTTWSWVMLTGIILTIPLDLILIPFSMQHFQNGAIGAALSFLVTEVGMTMIGLPMLPKGTLDRSSLWTAVRILLAGGVMALVAWLLRHWFIAVPMLAGAVTYIGMILFMKVLTKDDWDMLKAIWQNGVERFRRTPAPSSQVGD